jgi:signal transduction histidine kinase
VGILLTWYLPASASAQPTQKAVLVLYSTGREATVSIAGERQLPKLLGEGFQNGLDYHSEYIDSGRFSEPEYQAGFRDFLRLKYGGLRFDVLIAVLDTAIEFIDRNRDELFSGTPVVFFAQMTPARRIANATGAIAAVDFAQTLDLAIELQPDINQVFVVTGAALRDRALERQARTQFQRYERRLTFSYLSGLPTREVEARVAALPPHSIIYYILVYRDGAGERFQPLDYLDRIATRTNRPIYSWVDSTMDHHVVGGSMQAVDAQIDAVAALARRVLAGEPADSIPIVELRLNTNQVDWRELRRWNIDTGLIPPGTMIRYRDFGLWANHRGAILIGTTIVVVQGALIVGFLVQAAKRRRAEQQVHRSQAELRRSSERIRDLAGRLLSAQEAERARIARELHDDVGQQLSMLTLDLQLLSGARQTSDAAEKVAQAVERSDQIAKSIHDLSHRLHPSKLQLVGLVPALTGLQRELSESSKIDITFMRDQVPAHLPHDFTVCLFRVAQEALQNAVKHSGARNVSMYLQGTPDGVALTIIDDGVGFDVDAAWGKGLGLVSMSERLQSIGGTFVINSAPNAGTRLEIVVPVRPSEATGQLIAV